MRSRMTLVTGGARSGKSRFAQRLAAESGLPVVYLATASAGDPEMARRIEEHRRLRPTDWRTVEEGKDILGTIKGLRAPHTVLVDCITLWISNLLEEGLGDEEILQRARHLADFLPSSGHRIIIVTNEVGWGIVPPSPLGRRFRDLAGTVNQILARASDEVFLMVSGLPLRIKP